MWNLAACMLYVAVYLLIQLFLIFKCIEVTENRKKCFWIVVIYTIIFEALAFIIYAQPEFNNSETLQAAALALHALDTFILLGIINFFSDEYFPRDFILVTFYYDILTILPITNVAIDRIAAYLTAQGKGYSTFYFDADQPAELIMISYWIIKFLLVIAVCLLFNRNIKNLLKKIPDSICLLILILFFFQFIIKNILDLKADVYNNSAVIQGLVYTNCGLILLSVITMILLIVYAYQSKRFKALQNNENKLLHSYYTNISQIYSQIRNLKHDMANHLTVVRSSVMISSEKRSQYKANLLRACSEIDDNLEHQTSWTRIDTDLLSNREKYETYQCITATIDRCRIPLKNLSISTISTDNHTEVKFIIGIHNLSTRQFIAIKQLKNRSLAKEIIKQHHGTITLTKEKYSCSINLFLYR